MITADLSDKRTLVTGGASGIGLATVELFARCGAKVAINDLSGNPNLETQIQRLKTDGLDVIAAPGNVGDSKDCKRMVNQAIADLGGLDHLINNAGTPGTKTAIPLSDLEAVDEQFWNRIMDVNLLGPYLCSRTAAEALKDSGGAIVNTASQAGFTGTGSSIAYAASKAGLINLTRSLARGLAPEVRVNCIAPGMVDSPWECRFPGLDSPDAAERVPLKIVGQPSHYAEVMLFFAAGASYVTGQTLLVDGGLRV